MLLNVNGQRPCTRKPLAMCFVLLQKVKASASTHRRSEHHLGDAQNARTIRRLIQVPPLPIPAYLCHKIPLYFQHWNTHTDWAKIGADWIGSKLFFLSTKPIIIQHHVDIHNMLRPKCLEGMFIYGKQAGFARIWTNRLLVEAPNVMYESYAVDGVFYAP